MTIQFECAGCRRPLRVNDSRSGSMMRCPKCKAVCEVPAASSAAGTAPNPGAVVEAPEPRLDGSDADSCPHCGKPMALTAVLCIDCGYHRKTGQQLKTRTKRRALHWGNSPYTLLRFLVAGACALAAVGVIVLMVSLRDTDSPWYALGLEIFPLCGLVLAGSSSRYTVTRDAQGTPLLRHRSWFSFFAIRGYTLKLNDYDGLFLDYVPPVGKRPERYILQLRWKKDHEVFDTIYEGADQGMMGDLVDGIKEFTDLHLERR